MPSVQFLLFLLVSVSCLSTRLSEAEQSGWSFDPNTQYHIQTDEGPERYLRFQTLNGQYRKEKRLVDGTVIGTEGWLDPLGYLRLKDYIADHNGYRILRSKMVYVGRNRPIYNAVKETKTVPAQTGILVEPTRPPNPFRQSDTNYVRPLLSNDINSNYYISSTAKPKVDLSPASNDDYYYNSNPTSLPSSPRNLKNNQVQNSRYNFLPRSNEPSSRVPPYDGTHTVANGFQYYLKRQYHEEQQDPSGTNIGSFGYVDPFGIRRVIYYKTDPRNNGFLYEQNNKYVGLTGTPYDPSLANLYGRKLRNN
ncbi:uncharacterized protein LOC114874543 isoform X2 [Osmia bicornis bicornis]|uniref:uncharacterized protein LOC114874543 isoform X2 n=1 Tax=Osmia bicornis bicornis TaxID=1437191 RepID=UPI0010F7B186|nr:uncharacterized protein LOC114874543 isoform X2 [Osmia bicornis bicornis]XP_034189608.1 uncharacterized protein LOC117608497 isoform X2 [Osmia lignaria]